MALNIVRQVTGLSRRSLITKRLRRFYGLYEPDYLQTGKSKIPLYPVLNIQLKGYVYPLLESYQSYIHKLSDILDFDIENSWAMPHQEFKVQRFKQNSTVIAAEYTLKVYERNIQVSELSATLCPILIRILEATLPEGVSLRIEIYDPAYENKRYIPDKLLLDLKSELTVIKET